MASGSGWVRNGGVTRAVESKNPPFRLPIGLDAYEALEAKIENVLAETTVWRERAIKTGAKAPDFTLLDQDRQPVRLKAELESGPVVLAFVPAAFWPAEIAA